MIRVTGRSGRVKPDDFSLMTPAIDVTEVVHLVRVIIHAEEVAP